MKGLVLCHFYNLNYTSLVDYFIFGQKFEKMKKIILFIAFILPLALLAQNKEEIMKQIEANPKDENSLQLIQRLNPYNPDAKEMKLYFKKLDKSVRKSTKGKIFERYIKAVENASVGKKAPGITQFDLDGNPYSLQDLKGKYVLVDFWASWCPPCREENPKLVAIYQDFKDKNFEILGVSFDKDMNAWKKAIQDDKLTWKHISDLQHWNNGAAAIYGIKAIPQNILVDPNGIIVARNLHGEDLRKKLEEILK